MGLSVFVRLFYHHMVGHLNGHVEYKHRLIKYLACEYKLSRRGMSTLYLAVKVVMQHYCNEIRDTSILKRVEFINL